MSSIFNQNSDFHKHFKSNKLEKSDAPPKKTSKTPEPKPSKKQEAPAPAQSQESYILDLRNPKNHKNKKTSKLKTPNQTEKSSHSDLLSKINAKASWKTHLWTLSKASLIFLVTIIALNFDAFYQIWEFRVQQFLNLETENPLEELASQNLNPSIVSAPTLKIPPLDIEIIPQGNRIILPRLGKNVPIVGVAEEKLLLRDWTGLENDIQGALRNGVVHYPGTPQPNQSGNFVLTGHSSYFPWDPGRFKDVFAVLHNVVVGDEILVYHDMQKYRYKVEESFTITPDQISVLGDSGDNRLTLITCTPIGTNLKRLIVVAKPV